MKFQLKSLVAAAALAAAGVASAGVNPDVITVGAGQSVTVLDPAGSGRGAQLTLIGGGGALRFSNGGIGDNGLLADGTKPAAVGGLVAALNTGRVNLAPLDGATILAGARTTDTNVLVGTRKQRGLVSISANVVGLSADGNTGEIKVASSQGGASQTAPFIDGTLDGGKMSVFNLRFDLQNKVVIADMIAQPMVGGTVDDEGNTIQGTLGTATTFRDVALWNIGTIAGPTVLSPAGLLEAADGNFAPLEADGYKLLKTTPSTVAGWGPLYEVEANNVFSDLTVTKAGFDIFASGLGLVPGSIGYKALDGVNETGGWGSITSNIVFTAQEIPEPSTYALMGLGLVGISLVARRRAK